MSVIVVLDHPQDLVNIAHVVRGMKNFGLRDLRLLFQRLETSKVNLADDGIPIGGQDREPAGHVHVGRLHHPVEPGRPPGNQHPLRRW